MLRPHLPCRTTAEQNALRAWAERHALGKVAFGRPANANEASETKDAVHLLTNIKGFSSGALDHYCAFVASLGYGAVRACINNEDPTLFRHDLCGFLELIARFRSNEAVYQQAIYEENQHIIAILDGGYKSRNYLLTLCFGYQGMYRMLGTPAYASSTVALRAIVEQLPRAGAEWMMLAASDYDLEPTTILVGHSLLHEIDPTADIILFASGLEAEEKRLLVQARERLPTLIPDFESMDASSFARAVNELTEAAAGFDVISLKRLLLRLSSKGIILADRDTGRLISFREKPSFGQLFAISTQGDLLVNIMTTALRRALLGPLLGAFDALTSVSYPGKQLRAVVPFGFYNTLFASLSLAEDAWLADWAATKPADVGATEWRADGSAIRTAAVGLMSGRPIYVADLGAGSNANDLGEPEEYLSTCMNRAFTAPGRQRAGLPPQDEAASTVLGSSIEGVTLEVESARRLLIINSFIYGGGRLVVRNAHTRVAISHSVLHIPAGAEMVIDGHDAGARDERLGLVIESSWLVAGGVLRGSKGMIVGYDGRNDTKPVECIREVATTLFLTARNDEQPEGRVATKFSLDIVANHKDPVTKLRQLDIKCLRGRNFFEAIESMDLPARSAFQKEIAERVGGLVHRRADLDVAPVESGLDEAVDALTRTLEATPAAQRRAGMTALFERVFGTSGHGEVAVAAAPGRLNIGGAHTDWAFMRVMGFALDKGVYVAMAADSTSVVAGVDTTCSMYTCSVPHGSRRTIVRIPDGELPAKYDGRDKYVWANYVSGILAEVSKTSGRLPSLKVLIWSDLPMGCGLSSSAAIENAVTWAALGLTGRLPAEGTPAEKEALTTVASLCNRVENAFVGVMSGALDQMISALGREDNYVLVNCRHGSPQVSGEVPAPLSTEGYVVAILATGTNRSLVSVPLSLGAKDAAYEVGLSNFNRRVVRYWGGVALIRSIAEAAAVSIELASPENPSLVCSVADFRLARSHTPASAVFIELASPASRNPLCKSLPAGTATSWEGRAAAVEAMLGVGQLALVRADTTPVIIRDASLPEAYAQFHVLGGLTAAQLAAAQAAGKIEAGDVISTAPLLDLVQYMVQEDARIRGLADVLRGERGDWAGLLVPMMRENAQEWSTERVALNETLCEALTSGAVLTPAQEILLLGTLGDLSWMDKRELFKGDSDVGTLQAAYGVAALLNSPADPCACIGKIGAGAGWAGMAPVFVKATAVSKLRQLMTGRSEAGAALSADELSALGAPAGFVPYARRAELETGAGMRAEDVAVFAVAPARGVHMLK